MHLKLPKVTGHGGSLGDAASDSERKLSDDWAEATIASPLDDLCELIGKELCLATNMEVEPIDY